MEVKAEGINVYVTLQQAFGIRRGEIISLVGGGGKTTLMYALAHELALQEGVVITTTTTHILEPAPHQTQLLLIEADENEMVKKLGQLSHSLKHVTLVSKRLVGGKLKGISEELVIRMARNQKINYIIVEADGAAGRPLKAPNATEPVIPSNTSLVIPVMGIGAAGRQLEAESVFRPEIAAKLLGMSLGDIISLKSMAILLTHREGIVKGSPAQSRIIPFINKVDSDDSRTMAIKLASHILAEGHPQIREIVLGRAQGLDPVVEVIRAA